MNHTQHIAYTQHIAHAQHIDDTSINASESDTETTIILPAEIWKLISLYDLTVWCALNQVGKNYSAPGTYMIKKLLKQQRTHCLVSYNGALVSISDTPSEYSDQDRYWRSRFDTSKYCFVTDGCIIRSVGITTVSRLHTIKFDGTMVFFNNHLQKIKSSGKCVYMCSKPTKN